MLLHDMGAGEDEYWRQGVCKTVMTGAGKTPKEGTDTKSPIRTSTQSPCIPGQQNHGVSRDRERFPERYLCPITIPHSAQSVVPNTACGSLHEQRAHVIMYS